MGSGLLPGPTPRVGLALPSPLLGAAPPLGRAGEAQPRRGIASVWGRAAPAFVPHAHPRRAPPANPALLARPGPSPGPPRAGSAPSSSQLAARGFTPPLALSEPHASGCSSAPVPRPPPQPPPRVLLFSLSLAVEPGVLGLAPRRNHSAPLTLLRRLRALLGRPPSFPACAQLFAAGTRKRAPRLRPLRGLARSRRPLPAGWERSPRPPRRLALPKPSALPARALRAPASPGSCQCGDCAGKHGDRGNDPH